MDEWLVCAHCGAVVLKRRSGQGLCWRLSKTASFSRAQWEAFPFAASGPEAGRAEDSWAGANADGKGSGGCRPIAAPGPSLESQPLYELATMDSADTHGASCFTDERPQNGDVRPTALEPDCSVLLIEDDVELCALMR